MKFRPATRIPRWLRRLRNIWRRAFPPRALRIPGKWPWVQPKPLAFGFLLVETPGYKVVSDGRGGTLTLLKRLPRAGGPSRWRASRRGTR